VVIDLLSLFDRWSSKGHSPRGLGTNDTLPGAQPPGSPATCLVRRDAILRSAIAEHGGYVFATGGDGFGVVFARAADALRAALEAQVALTAEAWPEPARVRVRMGLHTRQVEARGGDYFGPAVNRAARLMTARHGGQLLASGTTTKKRASWRIRQDRRDWRGGPSTA